MYYAHSLITGAMPAQRHHRARDLAAAQSRGPSVPPGTRRVKQHAARGGGPARALAVLCSGWQPSSAKPPTSSGVASVAGIARFLRPLDSTVLCSVMRATMSSVMPALACSGARARS